MKLLSLAWKNIWRSPTRSSVVIIAIALGVWALIFLLAFTQGMVKSYINRTIENQTSHIQVHDPAWKDEHLLKHHFISRKVNEALADQPQVKAWSHRLLVDGMLQAPKSTQGVSIQGVDKDEELEVRQIADNIVKGTFLDTTSRLPIVIGEKLAEKLKLDLNTKVILTFPDTSGSVTSGAFRVNGVFQTNNSQWDERHVFVRKSDLHRLTGLQEGLAHETGILVNQLNMADTVSAQLSAELPELRVQTYSQLSPDIRLFADSLDLNQMIMTVIIMIALIFGIINTMLMAVLERTKELGMLMAIGMNRKRVFMMILYETILLGVAGMPFGLLIGYLSVYLGGEYGINLEMFASGMQQFGLDPVVKLSLPTEVYWQVALSVVVTAILASIYPSIKATRLKPVEALRKI